MAKEKNAKIAFAEALSFPDFETDLKGTYQLKNKQTVLAALMVLNQQNNFQIPEEKSKPD